MRQKFPAFLFCMFCAGAVQAQQTTELHFSFAQSQGATPVDRMRGEKAALGGEYSYVPGVSGDAVRFDGYTTRMTVKVADAEQVGQAIGRNGFTVEAWVALNTYPWNWVPVADQELDRQEGFFFGIDAFGHFALETSINGYWQRLVSKETLPLKKWAPLLPVS
jgi:hypothetical protein